MSINYWFKMVYYHVYIKYVDKTGKKQSLMHYDLDEEYVRKQIASPFMKNQRFLCLGLIIYPSKISRIVIFKSEKMYNELILPNKRRPLNEEHDYIVHCFYNVMVKSVIPCTEEFIISLPEKKEEIIKVPAKPSDKREKVFIVHGRDETQALRLQKYLNRNCKLDAEMFEDFKEKSGSNTIIEQLEYIKDNVGYAFVIVTPDDLGCLHENIDKCRTTMLVGKTRITVKSVCDILDNLHTRARQNVVFEHGLFIGALGRDRVCCLLQEDTKEKPSDINGILYVGFKKSVKETFTEITEKLKKAGLIKT